MAGNDNFKFSREYRGHRISVVAVFIPKMETWGLNVTVNGEMTNSFQTKDPWLDARTEIDKELYDLNMEEGGCPSGLLNPPINETPHYQQEKE